MGEKIGISGPSANSTVNIKYEDVFSMKELYKAVRDWLISEGYATAKSSEKMEDFYLEKISPSGAKEIWVWWRTSKVPHGSKYFEYHLNIDFHVLGMKDVEVMHQGQKVKANKGEVEIMINCYVELEAQYSFSKSFLGILGGQWFSNLFRKNIYKKQVDAHKKDLKGDLVKLQGFIKEFLELKSFLPKSELFHPARGMG